MENLEGKCSLKEHEKIIAICYCHECKIYMCKQCETYHSKLFQNHNQYNINEDIKEIISEFCKEKNHYDKLEFYCKSHNKLCCSGCITKIKSKDKGQHTDCDICLIKDIKNEKKNILSKNIESLEELSNNIEKSIKELKDMFVKINENKEELKIKIQQIFTKIRNKVNRREDEILSEIDYLFENTYVNATTIKKVDKLPKKIDLYLEKGKIIDKKWNSENKLSLLIQECINIEKNILEINQDNQIIKKNKNEKNTKIKFFPEEEIDINKLLFNIINFGEIYKEDITKNNKINEYKIFDIEIKSTNKEPNGISIELNGFSPEQYNKYYSKQFKYEEDEIVLTFCFEGKNINSLDSMCNFFNKEIKTNENFNFAIRKENNKLYLDLKLKKKINDYFEVIFELIMNLKELIEISFILKNNLNLNNFTKMNFDEFFLSFFSGIISIKSKIKDIPLLNLEKKREDLIKKIEEEEKSKEEIIEKDNLPLDVEEIEVNYRDDYYKMKRLKSFIEKIIILINIFINYHKNIKFDYMISLNKILETLKFFNGDKLNNFLIGIKNYIKNNFKTLFVNLLQYANIDCFLVTVLFGKYKSGFALNMNANGLTATINEIMPSKEELKYDVEIKDDLKEK